MAQAVRACQEAKPQISLWQTLFTDTDPDSIPIPRELLLKWVSVDCNEAVHLLQALQASNYHCQALALFALQVSFLVSFLLVHG